LKIQKTGNLKEDVIISFLHSMCVRFFNNIIFSKNFNKRKFYLFFSGWIFGEREEERRKKIQKSAKKLFFILLNSLRWK